MLVHQIESNLFKRTGAVTSNFKATLPDYQSDLTQQLFKDPYHFDFLMLTDSAKERDLENALINHITKMLLELGEGFAFQGRQYKIETGGQEYFIDLLFYHTKLRRHVVIELKIGDFLPEYVGKMNFYLGIVDDKLKGQYDEPPIGLILCKTKNKIIAEYALRDASKPIGIAEYKIAERLPEDIKADLPTIEEIQQKLDEGLQGPTDTYETKLDKLKQRLVSIQTEKIQTPLTPELYKTLVTNSLIPLYKRILEVLIPINELFAHNSFYWNGANNITALDKIEREWLSTEFYERHKELSFIYAFRGFLNAGTEAFDISFHLRCNLDTYWYGFILTNHNNQQPFLKKLYHQKLTDNDAEDITKIVYDQVINDIGYQLDYLKNTNKI